jgi:hypothetical protein
MFKISQELYSTEKLNELADNAVTIQNCTTDFILACMQKIYE